jgi:hypothetical protein
MLGVLHYKGINTAWKEVEQKREALLDQRRGCASEASSRRVGGTLPGRGGAVGLALLTIDPSIPGGRRVKPEIEFVYSTKRPSWGANGYKEKKDLCVTCCSPRSLKGWALCLPSFLASPQGAIFAKV